MLKILILHTPSGLDKIYKYLELKAAFDNDSKNLCIDKNYSILTHDQACQIMVPWSKRKYACESFIIQGTTDLFSQAKRLAELDQ
jgi:hypothetical protein